MITDSRLPSARESINSPDRNPQLIIGGRLSDHNTARFPPDRKQNGLAASDENPATANPVLFNQPSWKAWECRAVVYLVRRADHA
jgi:hypothetical protein